MKSLRIAAARVWVLSWALGAAACSNDRDQPLPAAGSSAAAGSTALAGAGMGAAGGDAGAGSGGSEQTMRAGMNGQAGSAGVSGGAGAAGAQAQAGVQAPATCMDSDNTFSEIGVGPASAWRKAKGTATGSNGTLDDACDADGNLIEQLCESVIGCTAPPGADCAPLPKATGLVTQMAVDCLGLCDDGACDIPCPELGAELGLSFDFAAQSFVLTPVDGEVRYLCARNPECASPLDAERVTVTSIPANLETAFSDCFEAFASESSPVRLSDGCAYYRCRTMRRP